MVSSLPPLPNTGCTTVQFYLLFLIGLLTSRNQFLKFLSTFIFLLNVVEGSSSLINLTTRKKRKNKNSGRKTGYSDKTIYVETRKTNKTKRGIGMKVHKRMGFGRA